MSDRPELVLRVCSLYPEYMNIYADRGNIAVFERRCAWRGIGFEHTAASLGDGLDPGAAELFYMGGGQDRDQAMVAGDMLRTKRDALAKGVAAGAVLLAVCGGYQLLGHGYTMGDERLPGLGLVDLDTVREEGPRLIGNCVIETELGAAGGGKRIIAGFENHGGRTYLGAGERPLGRVVAGHGNNGRDGTEGVWCHNLVGTYLHGPLLPKNAWLADELIARALERRYGQRPALAPLDDGLEDAVHAVAERVALRG